MDLIQELNKEQLSKEMPKVSVGDTAGFRAIMIWTA